MGSREDRGQVSIVKCSSAQSALKTCPSASRRAGEQTQAVRCEPPGGQSRKNMAFALFFVSPCLCERYAGTAENHFQIITTACRKWKPGRDIETTKGTNHTNEARGGEHRGFVLQGRKILFFGQVSDETGGKSANAESLGKPQIAQIRPARPSAGTKMLSRQSLP
jgi:hypothetical protein